MRASLYSFLVQVKEILSMVLYPIPCVIFSHLPIQSNKIVIENYRGRGFGCNPKYVIQKLIERGDADKYDLVWLVSRRNLAHSELPQQIRVVRYGFLRSYYEHATAKVWISNYHKLYFVRRGLRKRKDQVFIQMWHGSLGIKKIDGSVEILTQDKGWLRAAVTSSRMTDFWISNSDFETNVYKQAFWGVRDETVLLYGHPRNDIFFSTKKLRMAYQKVAKTYGMEGKKLLLYAPTFRDDYRIDCYAVSFLDVTKHLKHRFGGDWSVIVRLHPRAQDMSSTIIPNGADVADATLYADIQELLSAADCLITDYSSCAFDFMLTKRPVFLFATDIQQYEFERGFYYPLESTPFPLAHDNAELMKNIDDFQEDAYSTGIEAFLREKGCIEDGHASERVANLIMSLVQAGTV